MNVPSSPARPSSVSLDAVAQHQAVLGQLVGDRQHGGADALVVGRQEARRAASAAPRRRARRCRSAGRTRRARRPRSRRMSFLISSAADCQRAANSSSSRISASRAPRSAATQHISFDEVKCLGSPRTSQMPRSGSRQFSIARLHLLHEDRPEPLGQLVARLGVQVDRVEHRAPDVVLLLVVGAVADPHRPRALVAGQVVERLLLGSSASPSMPYMICSCPPRPRPRRR